MTIAEKLQAVATCIILVYVVTNTVSLIRSFWRAKRRQETYEYYD